MKIKFWILATTLALTAMARAATNDLTVLLQKGLFDEEANRDLTAAIADYQSLASAFDKDRQLAATAIFRLGECYRKLGKTNEAAAQYQRLIKEFSDQPTLVNLSRQNLAGMGSAAGTVVAASNSAISEPARQLAWVKKLQAMPLAEIRQVAPTVLTDATLINLIYQYNQVELDLIRLRTDHGEEHPEVQKEKAMQSALQDKIKERLNGMSQALSMELGVPSTNSGDHESAAPEVVTTDEEQTQIRNIQAMIQNSPDLINAPDSDGKTPLILAAEKGQLVVAKYLLDHGADVNGLSRNHGAVPLIAAAGNGHKAMVELLLERGADVSGGGLNPLYEAVSKGYLAVAEVLIAHKADVNARSGTDSNGMRPLHIAARDGRTELLQLLIQHGADVNVTDDQARNSRGYTPLELAAMQNEIPAAKILIAAKADVETRDKNRETPVEAAIHWNGGDKADMVSLLLDAGASADETNSDRATPLLYAVQSGAVDTIRVLLAHKADPNRMGSLVVDNSYGRYSPVFLAISKPEILKLLLEAGGKVEDTLYSAIDKGQVDSVRLLLEHGADPNEPSPKGVLPLVQAMENYKSKGAIPLLLDNGADPNARGNDPVDRTPLFLTQDPEIGRWLLAHKAEVNARDKQGNTPLMSALWNRTATNYIEMLLQAGAGIDLQNTNGNTALHYAVVAGSPDTVAILLAHKANPNIQNEVGSTPLDLAKSGSSGRITGQLLAADQNYLYTPNADNEKNIADQLLQAGGLADLPKRNRIEVRRGSSSAGGVAFTKGSRDWNRYSLLEMIAGNYGLISQSQAGEWRTISESRLSLWDRYLRFPDFKNVVVYRRTDASAKQKPINVNVKDILSSGDCSRDIWLEWGDVVEIPEADHPVDQKWGGLSAEEVNAIVKCVSREVTLVIKGESTKLNLAPQLIINPPGNDSYLTHASFMLRSVLDNSKLVRVSSDLSRVKVTRVDPDTKKKMEWLIDCTSPSQADLWLRDGDVIDVPEK